MDVERKTPVVIGRDATLSDAIRDLLRLDVQGDEIGVRFEDPSLLYAVTNTGFAFRKVVAIVAEDAIVDWIGGRSTFPGLRTFEISKNAPHAEFKAALFGLRHMGPYSYGKLTADGDVVKAVRAGDDDSLGRRHLEVGAIMYFTEHHPVDGVPDLTI